MKIKETLVTAFLFTLSLYATEIQKNHSLFVKPVEASMVFAGDQVLQQSNLALNFSTLLLLRSGELMDLPFVLDGEKLIFHMDYREDHGEIITWRGFNSARGASILLTIGKDLFFGHIYSAGEKWTFEPALEFGVITVSKIDPSLEKPSPKCSVEPDYNLVDRVLAQEKPIERSVGKAAATTCDQGDEIDVMILYTQGLVDLRGTGTMARIQNYVDVANESYINSEIHTRLNLVLAKLIDYPDYTPDTTGGNAESIEVALSDMSFNRGYYNSGVFDDLEDLRTQYGADQVTLINKLTGNEMSGGGAICGLAYLIKSNSIGSGSRLAYAVIEDGSICGTDDITYAHEVGHNMGCAHDRNTDNSVGKYSYSKGYQDSPNQFVTVMAYAYTCPGHCGYINHFSNPEVNFEGAPTGVPETEADSADNAKTINQTRSIMGQYREKKAGSFLEYHYVIPEVMYQGDLTTVINIVNKTVTGNADIELTGFTADGKKVNAAPVTMSLAPKSQKNFTFNSKFGSLSSQIAWIQIGASRPVYVFAEFSSPKIRSAYWANEKREFSVYVPHIAKRTAQFETMISTVNDSGKISDTTLHPQPFGNDVSLDSAGCFYGKSTGNAADYFGDYIELTDWAEILSTEQTVSSMEYFSYLPEREKIASLGLNSEVGNKLRFLHVATDTANFWTGLVYINVGSQNAEVTEHYYAADGQEIHSETLSLFQGEKRTLIFDADHTDPVGTAWIEIDTENQALVGYELFGSANNSPHQFFAGFQGSLTSGSKLDFPYVVSDAANWTGLVALNVGSQAANITFNAISASGTVLESVTESNVASKAKVVKTVSSLFSASTLSSVKWVQATTTGSDWSGFLLWGDKTETRNQLSGISAGIQ